MFATASGNARGLGDLRRPVQTDGAVNDEGAESGEIMMEHFCWRKHVSRKYTTGVPGDGVFSACERDNRGGKVVRQMDDAVGVSHDFLLLSFI